VSAGFVITVGVALAVSTTSLAVAAPTISSDYPSWADVQAAKASQAATQAEITKLAGLLTTLSDQVDAAGKDAAVKAELDNQARDALSAATAKTAKLTAQADAAKATAAKSAKRAAALIAQESPESFIGFVQQLMANQPAEGTEGLSDEQIQSLASAAGVPDAVVARIPDHEYAAWVRSASEDASKAGVLYTPTLGFNGDIQDPTDPASVQWSQEGALRQAIVTRSGA
jgi:hypothetical protein